MTKPLKEILKQASDNFVANKYYPFKNKDELEAMIEVLDCAKPETKKDAIMMVLAKWHKENLYRGEAFECGGCSYCNCDNCFMLLDGEACMGNHPYKVWDSIADGSRDGNLTKYANQIFAIALKAYEGEVNK